MNYDLNSLYEIISSALDPEMKSIMGSLSTADSSRSEYMMLPDKGENLSPSDVSRLIALSSNKYAFSCRLASLARAKFKMAESRYKYKYRTSLSSGKNAAERESNAMAAAQSEYDEMILAQVIVEICEAVESSNRIASESSRRMLLAADQYQKAEHRVYDHESSLNSRDFSGY